MTGRRTATGLLVGCGLMVFAIAAAAHGRMVLAALLGVAAIFEASC